MATATDREHLAATQVAEQLPPEYTVEQEGNVLFVKDRNGVFLAAIGFECTAGEMLCVVDTEASVKVCAPHAVPSELVR